jgi:hypothetical protein
MTLRSRIALLVVALSIAAVATATASATTAKLNIRPIGNDMYALTVDVYNSGYYPYGVDASFRLWGDDEWYDDLLYTVPGTVFGGYWTGHFGREFTVSGSTLNEDWGADEIYVDVRLFDRQPGKPVETIQTNRLYGSWS